MGTGAILVLSLLILGPAGLRGQTDSTVAPPPPRPIRAAWVSDRRSFPVGAIITVVVDERTTARERTSRIASADRRSNLGLNSDFKTASIASTNQASDRNLGEASRLGDLSSIFAVTVTGVEPSGMLRISGTRSVEIDGRKQEWVLSGLIRPEDIDAYNTIRSNRIADGVIHYKGKSIGPGRGIISKILGIFWP